MVVISTNVWKERSVRQTPLEKQSSRGGLGSQARILRLSAAGLRRSLLARRVARMAMRGLSWTPGRGLSSGSAAGSLATPLPPTARQERRVHGPSTPHLGAPWCDGSRRVDGRKSARAKARQLRHPAPKLGFLKSKSVSGRTEAAYRTAAREFQLWATARGRSTSTAALADAALEQFFDDSYFAGHNPTRGRYTVYGLAFVKDWVVTKSLFPKALRSLRGWSGLARERERWPMPWPAAVAMALHLAKNKRADSARILLVQFDLYLRASEATTLTWEQVTAPVPRVKPRVWAVRVAPSDETTEGSKADLESARQGLGRRLPSKTGAFDQTVLVGQTSSTEAGRGIMVTLFERWSRRRGKEKMLFSTPLASYEADVVKAAAALKLDALRLTSHTARHGGASMDYFLKARSLEDIRERGRWACEQSVRRYKKTGTYAEQLARLPPSLIVDLDANLIALAKML